MVRLYTLSFVLLYVQVCAFEKFTAATKTCENFTSRFMWHDMASILAIWFLHHWHTGGGKALE